MRSTAAFGRLEQFHSEPELDVGSAVQRPDAARPRFLVEGGDQAAVDVTEVTFPLLANDRERPSPDGATQGSSV